MGQRHWKRGKLPKRRNIRLRHLRRHGWLDKPRTMGMDRAEFAGAYLDVHNTDVPQPKPRVRRRGERGCFGARKRREARS